MIHMKKQILITYVSMLVILFTTFCLLFPVAFASELSAQAQVDSFIENALPLDLSKYDVPLKHHSQYASIDMFRYTLESDKSRLIIYCDVEQGIVTYCHVYSEKGQVNSDKKHDNLIDAVTSFLEKYQSYTKIDSTNLIEMLDEIDVTKNSTITKGDIKFTISNINDINATKKTVFKWFYMVNGAEYNSLKIGFQTKTMVFDALVDTRSLYSIGDPTVNVSSEQAIDIAVKYSESYSYSMPDGSKVAGFNITKDKTTTELLTTGLNTTELRPYWMVRMYLNQTYPGSVIGLTTFIWANNGEVFDCSNIAVGGAEDTSTTEPETALPTSPRDNTLPLIITAVAAVIAISAIVIVTKKRRK